MEDYYNPEVYNNPETAAISVGVMIALMATLLWGMRKSGFKAMVAVGNG